MGGPQRLPLAELVIDPKRMYILIWKFLTFLIYQKTKFWDELDYVSKGGRVDQLGKVSQVRWVQLVTTRRRKRRTTATLTKICSWTLKYCINFVISWTQDKYSENLMLSSYYLCVVTHEDTLSNWIYSLESRHSNK